MRLTVSRMGTLKCAQLKDRVFDRRLFIKIISKACFFTFFPYFFEAKFLVSLMFCWAYASLIIVGCPSEIGTTPVSLRLPEPVPLQL
jgi:hypothetical protein